MTTPNSPTTSSENPIKKEIEEIKEYRKERAEDVQTLGKTVRRMRERKWERMRGTFRNMTNLVIPGAGDVIYPAKKKEEPKVSATSTPSVEAKPEDKQEAKPAPTVAQEKSPKEKFGLKDAVDEKKAKGMWEKTKEELSSPENVKAIHDEMERVSGIKFTKPQPSLSDIMARRNPNVPRMEDKAPSLSEIAEKHRRNGVILGTTLPTKKGPTI